MKGSQGAIAAAITIRSSAKIHDVEVDGCPKFEICGYQPHVAPITPFNVCRSYSQTGSQDTSLAASDGSSFWPLQDTQRNGC